MASPLAGVAKQVAKGFKGKLFKGVLRRSTPNSVNSLGDVAAATTTTFAVEGIREEFSAFYRLQAGIPDDHCKLLLIAGLMTTDPRKDDLVQLPKTTGPWFKIMKIIAVDPVTATYTLEAAQVEAP